MKTRQGFVSNSSSSSFVVIGTRIKNEELIKMGWHDEDRNEDYDKIPKDIQIYYDEHDDGYIVGKSLCKSEDWGLENCELTSYELIDIMNDVNCKLKLPVKLLIGTRQT